MVAGAGTYVDQASVRLDAKDNVSSVLKRVQAAVSATISSLTGVGGAISRVFDGIRARIQRVVGSVANLGSRLTNVGTRLSLIGGAGTAGLTAAYMSSADAAESVNRFKAIFGDQAAAADKFAGRLAKAIRRSKTELIGALGDFGGFASGLGLSQEATRAMAEELTALSQDLGSFNNLSTGDSITKLLAAMSGEAEPVKRLGIDISATALKLRGIGEDATQTAKAIARLDIIRETLGRQGALVDAQKTAYSASNSMKALGSSVLDFQIAVGDSLEATTGLVNILDAMVRAATDFVKVNPGVVAGLAATTAGVTAFGIASVVTGSALSAIASVITIVTALLNPVGLVITAITAAVVALFVAVYDFKRVAGNIAGPFADSWSSMLVAVQSGDIQSAFQLVTLEMRRAWIEALDEMRLKWLLFKYNLADVFGATSLVDVHGAIAEMDKPLKQIEGQIKAVQERIRQSAAKAAKEVTKIPKEMVSKIDMHHSMPKFGAAAQPENPLDGWDMSALRNDLPRGLGDLVGAMERVYQQLGGLSLRSQESVNAFVQAANGARVDAIDRQTAVLEQIRDQMADNPERIGEEVGAAIDDSNGVVGLYRT